MDVTPANTTVNAAFFQPVAGLARRSSHARTCPDFSADDYLARAGIRHQRPGLSPGTRGALESLPHAGQLFCHAPQSTPVGAVVADVNNALRNLANQTLPARLAGMIPGIMG